MFRNQRRDSASTDGPCRLAAGVLLHTAVIDPASYPDVVILAATTWRRLGLPTPQVQGDVEAVADDDDDATASVLRDALHVAGFAALRAAIEDAHEPTP